MCGIAGFFTNNQLFSSVDLQAMTDSLAHRGPDAEGFFYNGNIGLGHRRLSILDLSPASNQPFYSKDQRYIIVYNGEVYNFKELRKSVDVPLRTTGDTEVILELFIKYGPSVINRLNGMFAIAIYDTVKRELFLTRDRLGVKPLYYYWDNSTFIFASELKAFQKIPLTGLDEVNYESLGDFLKLGYFPEPATIYKNVKKFPSGIYFRITPSGIEQNYYWKPEDFFSGTLLNDEEEAKKQLKDLVESSVRYRMISDVPYGTFLSGGIDSSLVTAVANKVGSKGKLKTFSIGFKDSAFDESVYSKQISSFLGTEHYEFNVTEKEAKDSLLQVMDHFDEPFSDSSALPTYIVSKMASKHVKMVLTGDGGDELFMGYGAYGWANRLSSHYIKSLSPFLETIFSKGNSRLKRISKMFSSYKSGKLKSHIFSQEQYFFTDFEIDKILLKNKYSSFDEHISVHSRPLLPSEEQALFDLKFYLKDDLLVKVDRTSMLASIEAREPLLDYRIAEFSFNLSPKLKIKNSEKKYLLKQLLYDYIPPQYFDRPKRGFSVPLAAWLSNDLRFLMEDYLSKEKISETGVFNENYVAELKRNFLSGQNYLFQRIWLMIILQRWLMERNYKN